MTTNKIICAYCGKKVHFEACIVGDKGAQCGYCVMEEYVDNLTRDQLLNIIHTGNGGANNGY